VSFKVLDTTHSPSTPSLKTIQDVPEKQLVNIFFSVILSSDCPTLAYDKLSKTCKKWRVVLEKDVKLNVLRTFLIGTHVSPETKISFFNIPSNLNPVWVQAEGQLVPFKGLYTNERLDSHSLADKVCRLLHNFHLRPTYTQVNSRFGNQCPNGSKFISNSTLKIFS